MIETLGALWFHLTQKSIIHCTQSEPAPFRGIIWQKRIEGKIFFHSWIISETLFYTSWSAFGFVQLLRAKA